MRRTPRDSGPQGTPPEDQESEGKFDFVKFFSARMDAFGPADPRFAGGVQYDLEEARIKDIRKFVPAIFFETGKNPRNQQKELWVGDPSVNADPEYLHHEAREELKVFLHKNGLLQRGYAPYHSAFILEDAIGCRHLIVGAYEGGQTQRDASRTDEGSKETVKKMFDLLKRYNISSFIGMMSGEDDPYKGAVYGSTPITLLGEDPVGKIREEQALYKYAEKYHMTNTQYMRFRTLTRASKEAVKPTSYLTPQRPEENSTVTYDDIARSVILDKALDEEDPFPLIENRKHP